ncbi:hypothetical protein FBR01_06905 [Anaerolineae bacterium CFX8]|nr:hypothetical protein [Anaerolineae bacterium CFX8]
MNRATSLGRLKVQSFGPAFWGAGVGVVIMVLIHVLTTDSGGWLVPVRADGSIITFIGSYFGFFFTRVPGLIILVASIVVYIAATVSLQSSSGTEAAFTGVMRGLLIGFGSSLNGVLAYNIYTSAFGNETVGLIIGIVLFALGFIASIGAVSQNGFYQGVIGWLCWSAPMSWGALGVGLVLLVISIVFGLLIGWPFNVHLFRIGGDPANSAPSIKGKLAQANWPTGTLFLVGGIGSNLNYAGTAYNMGNVGFIHRRAGGDFREHEAGHNLNLFVFGWIVHYVGAVDENIIGYRHLAFAEMCAESNDPHAANALEMWA